MARIHYDTAHRGRLLQRTVLGYLRQAFERFPVPLSEVTEIVVAGQHDDAGFCCSVSTCTRSGRSPIDSVTEHEMRAGRRQTTSLSVPAKKLRLPLHPDAVVHGLPIIGSHVGADAAAAFSRPDFTRVGRASRCSWTSAPTPSSSWATAIAIVAASCPAGPAFEGGGVLCGMPALDGAIERVAIGRGRGRLDTSSSGAAPPRVSVARDSSI